MTQVFASPGVRKAFLALVRIAAVLALASAALAQTQLTLQQAISTALEKNPERKASLFERKAAVADVKLARSALFPQLSFSELYQRGNDPVFVFGSKLRQQRFSALDFALNRLNTPTPFGNFVTRFSGGWQLFDSGASWARVRQARRMDEAAGRKLERSDQLLVMRVVESYAGLLLAAKRVQVAEEAMKTSQSILERSKANVESGMVVESDLLSAQVDHAAREQELIRASNDLALAHAQLNHDMGVAADTDYQPVELTAEVAAPPPLAAIEKSALATRPDLKGVAAQQSAQDDSVKIAKAAFGPRLNFVADWELDNPRFTGGGGNNWMTGIELQFDLFDGGNKSAKLARESALKQRIDNLSAAAESGVRLEVRKAYLDLDAAQQQVEVARAAVGQAQESLRIGQDRYNSGLNTITDLLRMQQASVGAQTGYWEAVYRLRTSYANLELAAGTLDANSPAVKQ